MRYITIPKPIPFIKGPDGKPVKKEEDGEGAWSFQRFLFMFPMAGQGALAQGGYKDAIAAEEIHEAIEHREPGEVVELSEDNWERLKRWIELAVKGMIPLFARQFLPLMRPVMNAPDKAPIKAVEGEAA